MGRVFADTTTPRTEKVVIPAKAGIHLSEAGAAEEWVPAFAGTTMFCLFGALVPC
jgi:hypothetical protein